MRVPERETLPFKRMQSMNEAEAQDFAEGWVAAWNAHDVDAVLAHFAGEITFSSPLVPIITGRENPLHGTEELRAYWTEGLRRLPNLHFTLRGVYCGVDAVTIAYENERGRPALEVLTLGKDGKAISGMALYGPAPDQA